jgi:cell wall-associated NlpC family hydrolase
MKGICLLSMAPVRKEPSNAAEMTTQLLFGETYSIETTNGEWLKIKADDDNYEGWINAKLNTSLHIMSTKQIALAIFPLACIITPQGSPIWIMPGSFLPDYDGTHMYVNGEAYPVKTISIEDNLSYATLAKQYLNAPYLWGGKGFFGIDCSGLTQVVYRMMGKKLLRDALQQATQGHTLAFRAEAQEGDLAFFDNDQGQITHVGIMLNSDTIIHASGMVRIDKIDDHGIINSNTGQYSHKLRIIKRYD